MGIYSNFFNQNSFGEGFSCENTELAKLSYVNISLDSQTQW